VRATREVAADAPAQDAWRVLAAGTWAGPIRLAVGPAAYAGAVTVVDVDEDDRSVGCHVQARGRESWAGVAAVLELRPSGAGGVSIEGDVEVVGGADERAAAALLDELAERVRRALTGGPAPTRSPAVAPPGAQPASPADDRAWRRRLAARAAAAVAVGAAAGLAIARRGSGR
jgi:hypothetical protein